MDINDAMLLATRAFTDAGGIRGVEAVVGEGFCPACLGRSSSGEVIEPDEEEDRLQPRPDAVVNCQRCLIRWRTGHDPVTGQLWVEHSHVLDHMVLTLMIQPPGE